MLQELTIRNFAIIDDLHINFSDGLTILSGETGAGKSIILNAVNLILGSRASSDLIRTGAEAAELAAFFRISPASPMAQILAEQDYAAENDLLIRRIISRSDSNRVYINSRLATIQLLTSITENLASISGQHAHQGLLQEDQHLLILDQFGDLLHLRQEVLDSYRTIMPLIERLKDLNAVKQRQAEHLQLLEFQKKEIIAAEIAPQEDTELEQQRQRLKNFELLFRTVFESIETLYGASGSVFERLSEVKRNLEKTGRIDAYLKSYADSLAEPCYHVEDLVEKLRTYLNSIQVDERQLETVEERLDTLNKLKRKYGGSLEAVFAKLESIQQELAGVENIVANIVETEAELASLHEQLVGLSLQLSKKRKQAARRLSNKVVKELGSLKMSPAEFKVLLRQTPADDNANTYLTNNSKLITETGIDRGTFMIAPNVGEEFKPLASIASGGELSRVVLALKAILARSDSVETIVFDEVDAGIGGGVAEVVGRKLSELARHHQVICITHLPQIAKFADHHFNIAKKVSKGRTKTTINPLNRQDRYKEIARMLGGEEITQATLDHAKEMLETEKNHRQKQR
jgi:DNA repair protein RecN (Recombination protein N)